VTEDPRIAALPDIHGHAKGEHKPFAEERPIPYTARMLFLWFYHACRRGSPRFLMVADHMNYLTFEDPAAVNLVRRALKLAQAGDLYGAAETAGVDLGHAQIVSEGLRKGIRYSIGAEVDNDPRCRPDAQNIVDAMRPDGMIRSVHFLPITHPQHGENWMWPFDNPEFGELFEVIGTERVWEIYMATLLDAIDKLPGHIVAHFYVPAKFGHWPDDAVLDGYEDRLLDACAERGMAVEVNSRYLYKFYAGDEAQLERFRSAHLRLLRKAKAKGVAVAVGSDAHSPKDQGRAFDAVLALLDEAEINEIAFPINGRLARVALRATEEILRQASAAAAPPAPEPVTPSANGSNVPAAEVPAPVAVAAGVEAAQASDHGAPGLGSEASDDVPAAPAAATAKVAKKRPPRKRAARPAAAAASDAETSEAAVEAAGPAADEAVAEAAIAPLPEAEPDAPAAVPEAAGPDADADRPATEVPADFEPVPEPVVEPVASRPIDADVPSEVAASTAEIPGEAGEPALAAKPEARVAEEPEAQVAEEPEAQVAEEPETQVAEESETQVAEEPETPVAEEPETLVAEPEIVAARPKARPRPKPRAKPVPSRAAAKPVAKSAATKSRPDRPAALKPVAKKAAATKSAAAKKSVPKTAASKKSATRPGVKPAKKAVAKKPAGARPAPAKAGKKAPAKRAAPVKKSSAKKAVKKKAIRARR
jgi:HisJ family histidinol phosphate phosphatase